MTIKKWWRRLDVPLQILFFLALFIILLMLFRALSDVFWLDCRSNNWIDMILGASENGGKKWHSLMALGYILSGIIVVWGLIILNQRALAQVQAAQAQEHAAQAQEHAVQTQLATIKSDIFDKAIDKLSSKKDINQQAGLFMLRDIAYKTNDKYREYTKNHIREPQDYTSIIMNLMIKILNSFENSLITIKGAKHDNISMSKSILISSGDDAFEIKQLIIDLFFKPSIDPKSIMQMYRENKKVRNENKKVTIKADLIKIDMSGAYLENVDMRSSDLERCQFDETILNKERQVYLSWKLLNASFFKADLSGIRIGSGGNLYEANFEGAKLKGVRIVYSNIKHANFKDANLSDANFTGSDFTGCQNLTLAQLEKVKCLYDVKGLDTDHEKELRKNNPNIFNPRKNEH